jgi:hypothetical protein
MNKEDDKICPAQFPSLLPVATVIVHEEVMSLLESPIITNVPHKTK